MSSKVVNVTGDNLKLCILQKQLLWGVGWLSCARVIGSHLCQGWQGKGSALQWVGRSSPRSVRGRTNSAGHSYFTNGSACCLYGPQGNTGNGHQHRPQLQQNHRTIHAHQQHLGPGCLRTALPNLGNLAQPFIIGVGELTLPLTWRGSGSWGPKWPTQLPPQITFRVSSWHLPTSTPAMTC